MLPLYSCAYIFPVYSTLVLKPHTLCIKSGKLSTLTLISD